MAEDKNLKDKEKQKKSEQNNEKVDKTLEEVQQSLTNSKEESKAKNSAKIKQMTSYQEQALQEATKSKGNKKVLIILLVILGVAALVGGGIALFFVFQPKPEEPASIVCDVRVLSYRVQNNIDPEEYVVLQESEEFSFTEETESKDHFTKDLNENITEIHDISMMYVINNTSGKEYLYSLDFEDVVIKNCIVTVKSSISDELIYINSTRRLVQLRYDKDITLEVRITVDDDTIADSNNTGCSGGVSLTLSVS